MRRFALLIAAGASLAGPARADGMRPFEAGSWASILAAHAGRPVIVHFWGMTCGPCRVEMPRWGKLLAEHRAVDVVTVDTDMPDASAADALGFLSASGVGTAEAWRFADPFVEKLYFSVDPQWQGEVPMTVLIARDGRRERMVGALDPAKIAAWLSSQGSRP